MADPAAASGPRWAAIAAPALVGLVWIAMLAISHRYIAVEASPLPFWDDLVMAPQLADPGSITLAWLWSPHNEHRIPLPRAIFIALMRMTHDFRSGMFFQVYGLAAIALAMILVARRIRGRTSVTDAFFPLLWMHLGASENLLRAFQISAVLPIGLACAILMIVAGTRGPLTRRGAIGIGACLFLLPLCGGAGWAQVPAIAAWLGWEGLWRRRSGVPLERGVVPALGLGAAAAGVLAVLYVVGLRSQLGPKEHAGFLQTLSSASGFLSMSLGPAGREAWPATAVLVLALSAATIVLLAAVARRRPEERSRALGLLACFAGTLTLALVVGWGRGLPGGEKWTPIRYVTMASPLLAWVYFAWLRLGSAPREGLVRFALFALMLGLVVHNFRFGTTHARQRMEIGRALARDAANGTPLEMLAQRHWRGFYWNEEDFLVLLGCLQRAGLAPFDRSEIRTRRAEPFAFLKVRPVDVRSDKPVRTASLEGAPVALMHAPAEVVFQVPPAARRVRARFGIAPFAYAEGDARTDGISFTVEQAGAALFTRSLDPASEPRDRGFQELAVDLREGTGGTLVLRAANARGRANAMDWCFWAAVEFE